MSSEPPAAHTASPPCDHGEPTTGTEAGVGWSWLGYRTRGFWGSLCPEIVLLCSLTAARGCKPQEGKGLLKCQCPLIPGPETTQIPIPQMCGHTSSQMRCCRGGTHRIARPGPSVRPAHRTLKKAKLHGVRVPWMELGSPASQEWAGAVSRDHQLLPTGACTLRGPLALQSQEGRVPR